MEQKYYTYILQSLKDSSYYIGYSKEPENRLAKHNNSKKGYTSTKQPWQTVHIESYGSKAEAIKREKELKKWKDREMLRRLIESSKNEHKKNPVG